MLPESLITNFKDDICNLGYVSAFTSRVSEDYARHHNLSTDEGKLLTSCSKSKMNIKCEAIADRRKRSVNLIN